MPVVLEPAEATAREHTALLEGCHVIYPFDMDRPVQAVSDAVSTAGRQSLRPWCPKAAVGDRLVVHGSRRGDPGRSAEILEVRGVAGEPPNYVRWADGHTSLFFPGENPVVRLGRMSAAETLVGDGRVKLSWAPRGAWRGVVFVLGLALCGVGIALLFLPGPGLLVLRLA